MTGDQQQDHSLIGFAEGGESMERHDVIMPRQKKVDTEKAGVEKAKG